MSDGTPVSIYRRRYQALQDISTAIVMSDRTEALTDYLLDVAIRHSDAGSGSLVLVNERGALSILSSQGLDDEYIRMFNDRGGDSISDAILRDRKPLLVQDLRKHPELQSPDRNHYRTHSFMSCPITYHGRILGVINLNDKKDGAPFTQDEMDLLQIIANNAAVVLENALLLHRLKTAAADLEQMNRLLIDSDILKTEFLMGLSHELRTPLNAIKGAVYHLDNDPTVSPGELREFHTIIASETGNLAGAIDSLIRFLAVEDEQAVPVRSPIDIAETLAGIPAGHLRSELDDRGIRLTVAPLPGPLWIMGDRLRISQIFTNLLSGLSHFLTDDAITLSAEPADDRILFYIDLSRPLPRSVLQQINSDSSLHPSAAHSRIRLYLARSAATSLRWSVVAENGPANSRVTLVCPRDRRETVNVFIRKSLERFIESLSGALNIETCSAMLSDDKTGELRIACAQGLDDEIVKATSLKLGDKIAGWVALEGEPLFISDITADARFQPQDIPHYNNASLMSFPLKAEGRVIGVLNLNNKRSAEPFTLRDYERARELINSFSRHLQQAFGSGVTEAELVRRISSLDSSFAIERDERDR